MREITHALDYASLRVTLREAGFTFTIRQLQLEAVGREAERQIFAARRQTYPLFPQAKKAGQPKFPLHEAVTKTYEIK